MSESLLDAGAILPGKIRSMAADTITARAYRHPVLDGRTVVRLVGSAVGPAEDPLVTANARATAQDLDKELKTRVVTLRFDVSGLAPGSDALTRMVGKSTLGRSLTGSSL